MESKGARAERILVVDDEENVRLLMCRYLRDEGFTTLQAPDGEAGVATALAERPAVILLDLTMPRLDGLSACRRLKSEPTLADTQIIVCTARTTKQDLIATIQAGADDYLAKPFQRDSLLAKVTRAVERRQTPRPFKSPISADRRQAFRKPVRWSVSWESVTCTSSFKCKVVDVSLLGMAFEFPRCRICSAATGRSHFPSGKVLELLVAVNTDVLIEVQGEAAHVEPITDRPGVSKVGIRFRKLAPHVEEIIRRVVEGQLAL